MQFSDSSAAILCRGCGLQKSLSADCCSFDTSADGCAACGDPITVTFDIVDAPDCVNTSHNLAQATATKCFWRKTAYVVEGDATWSIDITMGFVSASGAYGPGCNWYIRITFDDLSVAEFNTHTVMFWRFRGGACDMAGTYGLFDDGAFDDEGTCIVS